jgi:hypothetical protein
MTDIAAAPDADTERDRWSTYHVEWAIEREKAVRKGTIPPRDAQELAWAKQGVVPNAELDAVKRNG